MAKKQLGVIFGSRSCEREVAIISAVQLMRHADPEKYDVIPVYLDGKLKLFRRINAYVGDPIEYSDLLAKGINVESCEEMNERMRETFRKMIAETAEHPS